MLSQTSNSALNSLSDILEKYPRRRVLMFKAMEEIMGNLSPFNKGTRELLFAYTSDLNQCSMSYNFHKAASVASGLDESVFIALKTDINSPKIDDKLKPILRFIKKLTLTPDKITPADAQQIFDAGWDEHAYFDSVCICSIINCMNRIVTALGVEDDSPSSNHSDKMLFTLGYAG